MLKDSTTLDPTSPRTALTRTDATALTTALARYGIVAWDDVSQQMQLIPAGRNSDQPYRVPDADFRTRYWSDEHSDDADLRLEFHFTLDGVHCYAATNPFDDGTNHYTITSIGFIVPERPYVN